MGKIYHGTLELIGGTPLVEAENLEKKHHLEARPVSYTHLTLPTIA